MLSKTPSMKGIFPRFWAFRIDLREFRCKFLRVHILETSSMFTGTGP